MDPGHATPTHEDELIWGTPHGDAMYNSNNAMVWNVVRHMMHGTEAWSFVKMFSNTLNGRDALISFHSQHLGTGHVSKIMLNADKTLETIFWNGKARNFSRDGFIARISGAFADLDEHNESRSDEAKVCLVL